MCLKDILERLFYACNFDVLVDWQDRLLVICYHTRELGVLLSMYLIPEEFFRVEAEIRVAMRVGCRDLIRSAR